MTIRDVPISPVWNGHSRVAGATICGVSIAVQDEPTAWRRLTSSVCRRAFSSPEALIYEIGIAPAVAGVVSPMVIPHLSGPTILDVGCGGGRVTAKVAAATASTVVSIDPSAAQTRRVARRSTKHPLLSPTRATAERLPFRDRTFDAVLSSCALKHWPSPTDGLAECARVSRSGAPVVIVEIDGGSTPGEVRAFTLLTRVPPGLREAYIRFAIRTVVAVAPDAGALAAMFDGLPLAPPSVEKVPGMPFLIATANVV
jgi:ubiquinone/menaquinone biosynthesis C-methylase UbiE